MKRPELLSPAGSKEAFYAAIEAGCDAVYIGGYSFGARAFANNFSNEEIIECINYAHVYGVKVYVTVNTIVYENEIPVFLNYIDFLHKNNVDAIIIQDLGMFDLIRKTYPNLELHASTQMHIHNLSGVKLAENLGFKRVVLARETSIDLLEEIRKKTNIELEVFVHGALCVSYSGQCLMSSLIGGRSGNRGQCAGTCRLEYDLLDETGKKYNNDKYLLSTKDLNTLEKIGELIELGIDSFKIEGRMKRPEYVYLVTKLYRKAIDNYLKYKKTLITDDDIKNLKKIYNREFTNGYLFNSKSIINQYRPNHLGINIGKVIKKDNNKILIKLNEKISTGDGIRFLNKKEDTGLIVTKMFINGRDVKEASSGDIITIKENVDCDLNSIVIKTTDKKQIDEINKNLLLNTRKVEISGKIIVKKNNNLEMFISDGKNDINYKSDYIVEESINRPLTKDDINKQITKTQNTPYIFKKLEIETDNLSFVPIFRLNEIRRNILELLTEKRKYKIEYKKESYYIDVPDFEKKEEINILIRNKKYYEKVKDFNFHNLYLLEKDFNLINDERKILKLNRVIEKNKDYDTPLLVSEFGSIIDNCFTDFSLNVVNSYTVAFLHSIGVKRITLSQELDDKQLEELIYGYINRYKKHPNLEFIIYGKEEMMISKFNLLNGLDLSKKFFLKDKYNNKFPISVNDNLMTIYNYKTRNICNIKKYYNLGINYLRYEFLDEDKIILKSE